ncbi:hypothetical protein FRC00_005799 [Tulasnella sp. 408]|nr:hypothetical protein FRC00_005799 [Tulasnella sp. 408]
MDPLNAPLLEVPDPPEAFGQDGGKFYRAYDALAGEIDDDLTASLKEQLDGMLIFAGLFAGVNTAFLALTIPLLSADPSDDTNALLAQNNAILLQLAMGRNDSLPTDNPLPSGEFSPAHDIFLVNALFGLSLAFAIISSFLAVLGRQWLVYYRKRSGGGPDRQRWEQLKRFLGAKRWHLEIILDDVLPFLLQLGLIVFCISLIIYLHYLSPSISIIVGVPLYLGLAIFIASALCTLWDRFCPFHSPLSHFLSWGVQSSPALFRPVGSVILASLKPLRAVATGLTTTLERQMRILGRPSLLGRGGTGRLRTSRGEDTVWSKLQGVMTAIGREEENPDSLQVIALQRTICTSDDPATLLYATSNILAITDPAQLWSLWSDSGFRERFFVQFKNSPRLAPHFRGKDQAEVSSSAGQLYSATAAHWFMSLDLDWRNSLHWQKAILEFPREMIYISADRLSEVSIILIRNTLAHLMLQSSLIRTSTDSSAINQGVPIIKAAIEVLARPGYREHPDYQVILINILRYLNKTISVAEAQSSFSIEGSFEVWLACEPLLQIAQLPEAAKEEVRKVRTEIAELWLLAFTLTVGSRE